METVISHCILCDCTLTVSLHARFLKNLKIVAVDELHYYYGIFGRSEDMPV